MKIKYSDILKILIELMLIMKLGFVKLLGSWIPMFETQYDSYPECVLYLFLTVVCILYTRIVLKERANAFLRIEMAIALLIAIAGIIHAQKWNKLDLLAAISSAMPYFYCLLAYPIYVLLKKKYWSIKKIFNFILFWGTLACVLKMINCAAWYFTGAVIWNNLISSSTWILNGSLRINPPCLGILLIPISYYMYVETYRRRDKLKYLVPIGISILYSAVVHQARSILLYQIITIIAMVMFEHVSSLKKCIRYSVLIVATIVVINSSYFEKFLNSFSPTNKVSGQSTIARFNAIALFASKYISHPFWGMGFLSDKEKNVGAIGTGLGHLDDIGFLGSFFTLGIPLLLLLLLIIGRTFYLSYKVKRWNSNYSLLLFGMVVLFLTTGINISCFNGIYAFAVPFFVAIVEYTRLIPCAVRKV